MKLITLANQLASKLCGVEFKVCDSGTSVYIKLKNCKVKQIRVSNHGGRKTGSKCIEFRVDVMTCEKKGIYNKSSESRLLDFVNSRILEQV
jgi:hypothetical protein